MGCAPFDAHDGSLLGGEDLGAHREDGTCITLAGAAEGVFLDGAVEAEREPCTTVSRAVGGALGR